MLNQLFIFISVSEIILITLLIISIIYPEKRIWPPPSRNSWEFVVVWTLTFIAVGGIIVISLLEWDTFIITHWIRYIIGGAIFAFGMFFGTWGVVTLGTHGSSGLKYRLVTKGPYKYSRNPQYVGDSIALFGAIILANSWHALIASSLAIIGFLLAPLAEEPWLREQYGEEYLEYCKKVPRYI